MSISVKYGRKRDRDSSFSSQLIHDDRNSLAEVVHTENVLETPNAKQENGSTKRSLTTLLEYGVFQRGKTPSTSGSSNSASKGQGNLHQTYLELGQSKFDSTQCKYCNMVYTPGFKEESKKHDVYCTNNSSESIHSWNVSKKEEVIVWSNLDIWVVKSNRDQVPKCSVSGYILKIVGVPISTSLKSGFMKVQSLLSSTLGDASSPFKSTPAKESSEIEKIISWIYVAQSEDGKKHIAGVLITEPVSSAYSPSLIPSLNDHRTDLLAINTSLPPSASCVLGIAQIYSNPSYKRKGVASTLLDVARSNAIYGYTIPKEKLAFSQLTKEGQQLASAYVGSGNVLIL